MSENRVTTVTHLTKTLQDDPCAIHFVSPDASTSYFIRVATKVTSNVQAVKAIESHLTELTESLYVDKREFRLTRDESLRNKISQKIFLAIHHALLHARVHLKALFDDDRTEIEIFYSIVVENEVFSAGVGGGKLVKINDGHVMESQASNISAFPERPLKKVSLSWNEIQPGSYLAYLSKPKAQINTSQDLSSSLNAASTPVDSMQIIKKALSLPQGAVALFGFIAQNTKGKTSLQKSAKGADHLSKSFLFKDLTESEVALVLGLAHVRSFKIGETISREGSPGHSILLLSSGEITIESGGVEIVTRNSPGETFGESGFFEGHPRSASLIAKTDVTLLQIYNEPLWELFTKNPGVGLKVVTKIAAITSRKLREATERYKAKRKRAA